MHGLTKTTPMFVESALRAHGQKYDYSKTVYTGCNNKVIIICPVHGEFLQRPADHINASAGCKQCGYDRLSEMYRRSVSDIEDSANKVHNFAYSYDFSGYQNGSSRIIITCKKHGQFIQSVNDHLSGCGCKKCNMPNSRIERVWLQHLKVPEICFGGSLYVNNVRYNIDAYNSETNTIYEFYGDYWHGNPAVFDQNKVHPHLGITFGEVYQKTCIREENLKEAGYTLITIWEHVFRQQLKEKTNVVC